MKRQRIVVKIGSSSLTTPSGSLSINKLTEHVQALSRLKKQGHEVILISSGAVAAGFSALGYPTKPVTIAGKQAAASVGQGLLMQGYIEKFQNEGIIPAQILLTRDDFSDRHRFQNAYSTISELLKRGALPIINENDSTSIEELTFGDNDMLSALVSGFIHAHTLCILTDVNGLYSANPNLDPTAEKYDHLKEITPELLAMAGDSGSKVGTGGMKSKILAAETALSLGVNIFIGKGAGANKLIDIIAGNGDGTYIGSVQEEAMMPTNKQWIALHSTSSGSITVDRGAAFALQSLGKSLLPAGVLQIDGIFNRNEVIDVYNEEGLLIGKGKSNVSSGELNQIKGLSSMEAKRTLHLNKPEVIHRDHWVTITKSSSISN
ncbi:gamma-glutamyl kinase [Alkalihalobacillus alcalophilus ATCC 27647 = CGMCC 1.3604]|uniref:Glutamate 5-kinase n=1 Tax=Alkalihalobacillus alcalophilus ATCC 27647 = CGMCC 1.3604 TaxID=1218173 RepID=A0A094WMA1_ALKAL|nr:glutamate 5-kinase [Alkalihalobacillus alcalophilus]KGA97093.1 gamma-glutamyl kinase [Alkalihalobacillus alcalophilus ATCC 27647 = CGMCC 1.3604]MED1563063.1 glutamate 5-kinase [Alkalihalobacillus alcalophilus]THG88994.1 gamma-glutamyl kinase [Alkalihalobacillus alcalophilus ATCC 27647 = CGMCC 1.3604]